MFYGDYSPFFCIPAGNSSAILAYGMTAPTSIWSLMENPDVMLDTQMTHASSVSVGDGLTQDWFKFDLNQGELLFADVDHSVGIDTVTEIITADGVTRLAFNDVVPAGATQLGADGSASTLDSFLAFTADASGT